MAFTYDPATDAGRVRLLIGDRDEVNAIFSDDEISAFLSLESDSVNLAAALALETMARSEVLILKKVTTLDLATDGPAVAKALLETAKRLRETEEKNAGFEIAEQISTSWSWEERIRKQAMRGGL